MWCFLPLSQHWQYDGNVICFKDPVHVMLSILAIIILTVLVLLSPALFIFTNMANFRKSKVSREVPTRHVTCR